MKYFWGNYVRPLTYTRREKNMISEEYVKLNRLHFISLFVIKIFFIQFCAKDEDDIFQDVRRAICFISEKAKIFLFNIKCI